MPTIPVWTKPVLCTNWPKITMLFYYLKVPKDFSPLGPTLALTGASKWGNVWTFTSNGKGIMKGHTVPHFKAPVNAKVGPGGLKCGGTFM